MQKKHLILLITGLSVTALFISCMDSTDHKNESPGGIIHDSLVKRGSYLVTSMLCDDCHSPKRMGAQGPEIIPELRLSGFSQNNKLPKVDTNELKKGWVLFNEDLTSAVGSWGVSFSANITSDASGVGNWSFDQFKKAITTGKYKGLDGGRQLLPPMPWPNFSKVNDADLRAIFAFLKSTKPVRNVVPAPKKLAELN